MLPDSKSPYSKCRSRWLVALGLAWLSCLIFLIAWTSHGKATLAKALRLNREFGVEEYTLKGLLQGGWIVFAIITLLLITLRWWFRWSERPTETAVTQNRPQGRWQWTGLLAVLLIASALRVPYLDQGILWDEHDNLRRNFHGYTALDAKPDKNPWNEAGYREAFFENERANNPFFYSVLAHASLDIWRAVTGTPRDRFNVVPMRIPAICFGLLGIATVWGLGRRLGGPGVGFTAALVCALHPLHLRYSVEARGYSVVLWLAPLFLSQCWEIIRSGSWRNAFGVSFTAAGLLYAFPGGVYFIALGALVLLWALLWQERSPENRASVVRLIVAGSLALGVMVFLMLPGIMQAVKNLESQFQKNGLAAPWFAQTWHWMSAGVHEPMDAEYYELRDGKLPWLQYFKEYLMHAPVTFTVALVLVPLLLVAGIRTLWQRGTGARAVIFISVGAPVLCLLHHGLMTHYSIFQWYMIYALPPLVVVASVGAVELVGSFTAKTSLMQWAAWGSLVGVYVLATFPPARHRLGGYTHWSTDTNLPTAHSTFVRGPNVWETYQDGRVLRLGKVAKPNPADGP